MVDWVQAEGWFVQTGPLHLFRSSKDSAFRLTKKTRVGPRDSYLVEFNPGEMDDVWGKEVVLIERGTKPLKWKAEKLRTFDAEDGKIRDQYRDGINASMPSANADTLRLVGEIEVDGEKEIVIFVIAEGAVKDDAGVAHDLLIMSLSSDLELFGTMKLMEDGTGHSRPRP